MFFVFLLFFGLSWISLFDHPDEVFKWPRRCSTCRHAPLAWLHCWTCIAWCLVRAALRWTSCQCIRSIWAHASCRFRDSRTSTSRSWGCLGHAWLRIRWHGPCTCCRPRRKWSRGSSSWYWWRPSRWRSSSHCKSESEIASLPFVVDCRRNTDSFQILFETNSIFFIFIVFWKHILLQNQFSIFRLIYILVHIIYNHR